MPELPEVETIARGVDARVRGDRIVDVWFGTHREPFKTPPSRQAKALEGRSILSVHRTGKHIVLELGTVSDLARKVIPSNLENRADAQWIVHLGMTGRLLVTTPESARGAAYPCASDARKRQRTSLRRSSALRQA